MNFTFGIVTAGGNDNYISNIVETIKNDVPDGYYEIIIVGNTPINGKNIVNVPFEEHIKPMWISKKKNLITELAKFDNIVYLHDYVNLEPGWYQGFLRFGDGWDVCMTPIKNADGNRFRDWCLCPWPPYQNIGETFNKLIPYNERFLWRHQYISGAYWVAKRAVMRLVRLNEELCWGQGEDVEWSYRITREYQLKLNVNSSVKLLKQKDCVFHEIDENTLNRYKTIGD
jgi:hypothetical protein